MERSEDRAAAPLDVIVNVDDPRIDPEPLRRAVLHTVAAGGQAGESPAAGEISVTLLDDDGIRAINRDYLERDRPTDVIAFSLGDEHALLGDIYLGLERARCQAADEGVALEEELVRLAVHGTLHVLGLDHPEGEDRVESPMFTLQERLVRELVAD